MLERLGSNLTDMVKVFRRLRRVESALQDLNDVFDARCADILIALRAADQKANFKLITDAPVAIFSDDHKFPRGTANDNTRYPRLCYKLETMFPGQTLSVLDMGCAGGGLVYNFIQRGHSAIGLEGSDYSLKSQRAEWPIIPHNLRTCDITKKFQLQNLDGTQKKFDVITAWEVLEHIPEASIPQLFANVRNHLKSDGLFLASVAQFEDRDEATGAIWHVTLKERSWWEEQVKAAGLSVWSDHPFSTVDFPRGSGNGPNDWSADSNSELGFHLVVRNQGQ